MSIIDGVKNRVNNLRDGVYTPYEIILSCFDSITYKLSRKVPGFYVQHFKKKFIDGQTYKFKDVRLPILQNKNEEIFFFIHVYLDTFYSYMYRNDRYDEKNFDYCDVFLPEGLYGLVNDKVNVTVEPGDVVIDAGSWIGDFAAYAAGAKKAKVFAFEPAEKSFLELQKTAELNPGIIPVKKAIGNSEQRSVDIQKGVYGSNDFEVTTLDDFVRENNLSRVDFIKADIEGAERHMLAGAQETLKNFAPKLALCTYHLPDDPQVMADLILKANPKYNIVQKRKKLFASVPE